jgi:glycosyltransferase involved in cell wall biosynthesis
VRQGFGSGRPLRIGIDVTAMPRRRAGAGTYMHRLVQALLELDTPHAFVIFAKASDRTLWGQPRLPHLVWPVRAAGRVSTRLVWEQVGLPWLAHRLRLDVVHSTHYTSPLALRLPSVVTFCDMTFVQRPEVHTLMKRLLFPRLMRASVARARRLIAISESTRRDVLATYPIAPERVVTIPLAAGSEWRPQATDRVHDATKRYGLLPRSYVLYVGVLEPRKDVPTLIAAFRRLADTRPGLVLALGGKRGWMAEAVDAAIARAGLGDRIRILGYVPEADLPALISGAAVFAYPSLYEGFGLPVLEAMACGTPVVTTRVSAMPEVAGDAALMVEPGDPAALGLALAQVLDQPAFAAELAQRGLAAAGRFSWARCARESVAVYEGCVVTG